MLTTSTLNRKLFQHWYERHDLTDFEWRVIKPLLPNKPRGLRVSMTGAF
jgi:hypothetical protein